MNGAIAESLGKLADAAIKIADAIGFATHAAPQTIRELCIAGCFAAPLAIVTHHACAWLRGVK